MLTIGILSVVGAVIAAVVGTFWYSSGTPMGKLHMKSLGFDKLSQEEKDQKIKEAMPGMWKVYLGQIALSFLTALSVVVIVIMSMRNGQPFGMALAFVAFNWLTFVVPTIGSGILWSNCDRSIAWKKFFSDIASNLVTLLIVAFLASLFA